MYRCVCVDAHVSTISNVSEIANTHFFAKADLLSDIIIGNFQCSCLQYLFYFEFRVNVNTLAEW